MNIIIQYLLKGLSLLHRWYYPLGENLTLSSIPLGSRLDLPTIDGGIAFFLLIAHIYSPFQFYLGILPYHRAPQHNS
jgi:hypothetical protein